MRYGDSREFLLEERRLEVPFILISYLLHTVQMSFSHNHLDSPDSCLHAFGLEGWFLVVVFSRTRAGLRFLLLQLCVTIGSFTVRCKTMIAF